MIATNDDNAEDAAWAASAARVRAGIERQAAAAVPIAACRGRFIEDAAAEFDRAILFFRTATQSPIELALAAAMVEQWQRYAMVHWLASEFDPERLEAMDRVGSFGFVQARVGVYHADFLIWQRDHRGTARIYVIECDGHDFHERTKAQAAHDRSRDRWMTEHGITVLRFTGSEIWASPSKCADQIGRVLWPSPESAG